MDTSPGAARGPADPAAPGGGGPGQPQTPGDPRATDAPGDPDDPEAAGPGDPEAAGPGDPEAAGPGDEPGPHDPLRFGNWMKRSTAGAVLSGVAFGLQQVFEPKREIPAFVMEAPDGPGDPDAPVTLHFDPDDPGGTVAVVRRPASAPQEDAPAPDGDRAGAGDTGPDPRRPGGPEGEAG